MTSATRSSPAVRSGLFVDRPTRGGGVDRRREPAVATIGQRLASEYPDTNSGRTFSSPRFRSRSQGRSDTRLAGCRPRRARDSRAAVNLAGLVLRAASAASATSRPARTRGGALRIVLESIAEGLVLTAARALLGALIAHGALGMLGGSWHDLPRLAEVAVDARTFVALALTAAAIACGVGLMPLVMMRQLRATAARENRHETASRQPFACEPQSSSARLRSRFCCWQPRRCWLEPADRAGRPLGFETDQVVPCDVGAADR